MRDMAPATVLVVDDDPVILKLLEVNFEMEGFEVVRAADGFEGLERAREVLPDIVVLDVMMPRMTGYEVAKALREGDTTAHIPIIFVTARAQSSDVERGMELGVDDYVTKRFSPRELVLRVGSVLRPAAGWVLRLHVRWWRRTGARSRYQPRAGLPLRADPAPGRDRCATPARLTGV